MKRKQTLKTNTDLVVDVMESSRGGALMQMFITTALENYAKYIVKPDEAGTLDTGGFIHATAWAACARELLEKFDKFYKREKAA